MDLLLQAARVLELEAVHGGSDRMSAKTARGAYILQFTKATSKNSQQILMENGAGTGEEEDIPSTERTSRRLGTVGTREVHNQLEKNRRRQLREFFTHLQQCVPSLENKRVATQSILQGAIKHIKNLKKKDVEQEREIQMLARRKSELKKKYDQELSKCTEEQHHVAPGLLHVSSAAQVEEHHHVAHPAEARQVLDEETSDSTSTASEGENSQEDVGCKEEEKHENLELYPRKTIGLPTSNQYRPDDGSLAPTTSSSSAALKHMLEQRKRSQAAAISSSSSSTWYEAGMLQEAVQQPGKLKYSHPMITTHLASATRTNTSVTCHMTSAVNSFSLGTIGAMSPSSAGPKMGLPTGAVSPSSAGPKMGVVRKTKKVMCEKTKTEKCDPQNSTSLHAPALFPANITFVPTPTSVGDRSALAGSTDVPANITFVPTPTNMGDRNILAGSADVTDLVCSGTINSCLDTSVTCAPAVSSGLSHILTLTNTPGIMSSRFDPTNFLLPSSVLADHSHKLTLQVTSSSSSQSTSAPVSLTQTLVPPSAVSGPLTGTLVPRSAVSGPLTRTLVPPSTVSAPLTGTLVPRSAVNGPPLNPAPVSLVPLSVVNGPSSIANGPSLNPAPVSLVPLSVVNGPSSIANGPPLNGTTSLRILTPIHHNSMIAATLTSGHSVLALSSGQTIVPALTSRQSIVPTLTQLDSSGQVLIPGSQHILTQPLVVMTTLGPTFRTSSTATSSSS